MIRAIAAIDNRRGIAANGHIPWDIPEDSQYFRDQTQTGAVVMGRHTHEVDIKNAMPNRRNVIISSNIHDAPEGFEVASDLTTFLKTCNEDVWIVGGQALYETALSFCDELYLTHVAGDFNCDRFFPEYAGYELSQRSPEREQNGYKFYYAIYVKNRQV